MATNEKSMNSNGVVSIHLPCQYGYMRIARQTVLDFCARAGMTEFQSTQLEMAVDEACTNIIEHGFTQTPETKKIGLQMNLSMGTNSVVVEIIDHSLGFDYHEQGQILPDDYIKGEHSRGLGMFIINNFVDTLEYTRDPQNGNLLRLIKHVSL